jgi:predicted acetyltransferase
MKIKSIIRPLSETEHAEYLRLAFKSFPRKGGFDDTFIEKTLKIYEEKTSKGVVVVPQGLFRNGELLGGMYFRDFKLNFHDELVLMGGLGFVATDLLHKKEGVAREMVTYFLEHFDAKGAAVVSLYAFRLDFYKKMGFGFGTKTSQYRIRPNDLPRREKTNLAFLEADDLPLMTDCYNRYSKRNHGMIIHSHGWWVNLIGKDKYTVGYFQNNQLKGYCNFEYIEGDSRPYDFNLKVNHFIYENREAFSHLIGFLASQIDQVEYIVFETQDDDFHFILNNPINGRSPEVWLNHQSNVQEVGICYRVINIPRSFEQQKERNFGDANLIININISDNFYPQNNGPTIVQFNDGTPNILEAFSEFDVEISMDISDFSALIMGVIGFKKLYDYGLAEISDKLFLLRIDKLFQSSQPVCITRF